MSDSGIGMGRQRRRKLIARLLANSALAGIVAAPELVFAQVGEKADPGVSEELAVTPTADSAGLDVATITDAEAGGRVIFEADNVFRASSDAPILAEGNVKAYFGERYLRADKLSYDPATEIVIAEGNVSITDENLQTAFAGRVELSGDLRDGVVENFSALLEDNARLAAASGVREQGARTKLSQAVFTACNVCSEEGEGKVPTWRIRALKVTRDEERKVIRFRHAFFEIKGVPILYSPFLQAPDPSVERQSGFLTPNIGASSRLGFNLEMPYYLAISNSQDATFHPKYTANDGVLWQAEWRRRSQSGYHVWDGGVIDFDKTNDPSGNAPGVRWHLFGQGRHNIGSGWRTSYDIERVSDDTYLRRYDVERRGDLKQELDRTRTNRLRSNTRVAWQDDSSLFTADAYLFQGLRSSDDSAKTPYVLPLLNYRHDLASPVGGGLVTFNANLASLQRTGGTDSRRFTASAYWEREHITRSGHRFHMFAEARGDAYFFQDLNEGTELPGSIVNKESDFVARLAPSAGVEWSYPLARRFAGARLFLEPRVQLVASPAGANPSDIVNEDSRSIEFDYAGLFDYNKSTGYDAFEDGQRINAGVAASAVWPNGVKIDGSVGQQFRLQTTSAFNPSTGLGEKNSDIVGSLNIRYKNIATLENRFRVDNDSGNIQRMESLATFNYWRLRGSASYVRLNEENANNDLTRREELTATVRLRLSKHWTTGMSWRENLISDSTVRQDFMIGYRDECASIDLTYRRDRTQDTTQGLLPDNAILLRFTLRSLVD